jgi:hypothetical protein
VADVYRAASRSEKTKRAMPKLFSPWAVDGPLRTAFELILEQDDEDAVFDFALKMEGFVGDKHWEQDSAFQQLHGEVLWRQSPNDADRLGEAQNKFAAALMLNPRNLRTVQAMADLEVAVQTNHEAMMGGNVVSLSQRSAASSQQASQRTEDSEEEEEGDGAVSSCVM